MLDLQGKGQQTQPRLLAKVTLALPGRTYHSPLLGLEDLGQSAWPSEIREFVSGVETLLLSKQDLCVVSVLKRWFPLSLLSHKS